MAKVLHMPFISNKPQRRSSAQLGRPLTAAEKLENLDWYLTHCDKCKAEVAWGAEVCETCGYELMEFGKN